MNARILSGFLVLSLSLLLLGPGYAQAATYPATIKYRQTMTKVLDETQVQGWPTGYETVGRHIQEIAASADNAIVAFTVKLDIYSNKRLYVMKRDGTELVDCTPYLTAAGVDPNNVYGLRMSHNGLRLFFFGVYGTDIYYLVPWFIWQVYPAFKGLAGGDGRWPYSVNYDGTRLFFKHVVNSGSLEAVPGLYYADVGDPQYIPHLVLNMNQLPGPQNSNVLRFLGATENGSALWCTYFGSAAGNSTAMWRATAGNAPVKIPYEDHTYVWGEQDLPCTIFSHWLTNADGYLYAFQDSGLEQLYYGDLGGKKRLLSGDGGPYTFPTLYDDGAFCRIARFTGAFHKATRVNLLTGEQRDTHSYWFGESNTPYYLTDLTDCGRWYLMASKPVDQTARIHLIDMTAPPGSGWAPNISSISFSKPEWFYNDPTPLTITAQVSDPKGLDNLLWVKMQALVDGLEQPAWLTNGWKPITEGQMTDSGGGVFTVTSNLYKLSSFYTHYSLPHEVGIRLIAKNKDANYTIADTTITISKGAAGVSGTLPLLLD